MTLEDKMALRIQRRLRLSCARTLRHAWMRQRHSAVVKLQGVWRQWVMRRATEVLKKKTALALLLQRIFRGRGGLLFTRELKLFTQQQSAIRLIQRVYRGYVGRVRTALKTDFLLQISQVTSRVSFLELTPGDIDDLVEAIDAYINDFERDLPIFLLTVIRAVMYMFNGDTGEVVTVDMNSGGGVLVLKAKELSWISAKQFLLRKGRLLRRLKALARRITLPDPAPLCFIDDCVTHLRAMQQCGVTVLEFKAMTLGRKAAAQLYRIVMNFARAHELQSLFPEYFSPGHPDWFRRLLHLRRVYEEAEMARLVEVSCERRLEELRVEIVKAGHKWGSVAKALVESKAVMGGIGVRKRQASNRLQRYLFILEQTVVKRIAVMNNLERTRQLGLTVALNEVRLYKECALHIDPKKMKAYYRDIDKRALDLLDTQARIIVTSDGIANDKEARDFDRSLLFDEIHAQCVVVGRAKADLMVTAHTWTLFLDSIGGAQFLPDHVGEAKQYYDKTRADTLTLMTRRREALVAIDTGAKYGYDTARKFAQKVKRQFMDHAWDACTGIEVEYETEEDTECARREAAEMKQVGRFGVDIDVPVMLFKPCLVLLDKRIPKQTLTTMQTYLTRLNCLSCSAPNLDTEMMLQAQTHFDAQSHSLVLVDRGLHRTSRGRFTASINAVVSGLIPVPKVVAVDASACMRVDHWHSSLALHQASIFVGATEDAADAILSLGRLRHIAATLRHCLCEFGDVDGDVGVDVGSELDATSTVRDNHSSKCRCRYRPHRQQQRQH